MNTTITIKENMTIIKPEGRLDAITSEKFQTESTEQVQNGINIILDFSELEYMSSAGLRSILFIGKKVASMDSNFAVTGMAGAVAEVFQLSGFEGMIKAFQSVEEAQATFA